MQSIIRYIGEVGDLVIGRICGVDMKRWKVEIAGQRDAVLQLSAVNLPGGVQRMRTYEDQLSMRTLFCENDLVIKILVCRKDNIILRHHSLIGFGGNSKH